MTKDELIEKYRDINVEHDWWEWVYADFTCEMNKVGVSVDEINFRGFWSQGDHATFSCSMRSSVETFIESHNLHEQYNAIYKLSSQGGVVIHKKLDRYSEVECEPWGYYDACEDEDMNEFYKVQYQEEVDTTYTEFDKDVIKILEGYEDDLYRQLEREYDSLTSDEVVWETIVGNELDEEWDENINRGLKIGGCYA
jgi:hypothetical protein